MFRFPLPFLKFLLFLFLLGSFSGIHAQKYNLREIVTRRFAYLNHHDISDLSALYDDSAKIVSPNFTGTSTGPAGIRDIYGRYFRSTPDLSYQITRMILADSTAVVEFISKGTLDSLEKGVPAFMKGKSYSLKNCEVLDFRNGKIISDSSYFDQVSFLRQMGYFDRQK